MGLCFFCFFVFFGQNPNVLPPGYQFYAQFLFCFRLFKLKLFSVFKDKVTALHRLHHVKIIFFNVTSTYFLLLSSFPLLPDSSVCHFCLLFYSLCAKCYNVCHTTTIKLLLVLLKLFSPKLYIRDAPSAYQIQSQNTNRPIEHNSRLPYYPNLVCSTHGLLFHCIYSLPHDFIHSYMYIGYGGYMEQTEGHKMHNSCLNTFKLKTDTNHIFTTYGFTPISASLSSICTWVSSPIVFMTGYIFSEPPLSCFSHSMPSLYFWSYIFTFMATISTQLASGYYKYQKGTIAIHKHNVETTKRLDDPVSACHPLLMYQGWF